MVHQKILEIMQAIQYLNKDDTIGFGKSTYKAISEEKVTLTVREQLIKHHLTIYPVNMVHSRTDYETINETGKRSCMHLATVDVTYRVTDVDDGSYIEVMSSGTGVDSQDKAVGKAMTYAYKYLMLRLFAIPTGEDPDKIASQKIDKDFGSLVDPAKVYITGKHINELYAAAAEKGFEAAKLDKSIKKNYNVRIQALTLDQFEEIMKSLNK